MKTNEEFLQDILQRLDTLSYIKPEQIPDIDLYMDQVTTFMEEHLKKAKRNPDDKVLTKTMINNYAKNNLLPPPVKKKYNKEHMLLLIFIYYYKNLLSFNDIEKLFKPITDNHFAQNDNLKLVEIYRELFSLEADQIDNMKKDVLEKYRAANEKFASDSKTSPSSVDSDYLKLFAFIGELAFDVYLKKQMIEMLIDQM